MVKYFTYQFEMSKYKGYRLLEEKSNFDSFKKLIYDGFKIVYSASEFIYYEIDIKLIRKLKLKKINGEIKINSKEYKLSRLLEISKEEVEPLATSTTVYGYSFIYGPSYGTAGPAFNESIYQNSQNKNRERFLKKQYNNKVKQYESKGRFRK